MAQQRQAALRRRTGNSASGRDVTLLAQASNARSARARACVARAQHGHRTVVAAWMDCRQACCFCSLARGGPVAAAFLPFR